jgi:hypothetical protein
LIPSTHHVFPFILLTRFDQKASIKIVENPNLEREKRESSPTSMEVRRKVAAPLPGFPIGANSRRGRGGGGLGLAGAALGTRDGARREHAGEDEGANRGGGTLGKRIGERLAANDVS